MKLTANRLIAAFSFATLLATGCASEGDELLTDEELSAIEEEDLAASESSLAALPTLTLSVSKKCVNGVLNASGLAKTNASSVQVTFTISGGTLPISAPGGFFNFNPGGSGVLKAKACNSSGCSTRSNSIQWVPCGGTNPPL